MKTFRFTSMADFLRWKEGIETDTLSNYVKEGGRLKRPNGITAAYYYCNRSGTYQPRGTGRRRLKSIGSSKINDKCPARMCLKITDKGLFVKLYDIHENHEPDLGHLRLPPSVKASVAERLAEGVPITRIVDDVRSLVDTCMEKDTVVPRTSLITRKDVLNIKRDFILNHTVERHELDYVGNGEPRDDYSSIDDRKEMKNSPPQTKDIKEEKNDLDEFTTIACEPLQHPGQSGVNLTTFGNGEPRYDYSSIDDRKEMKNSLPQTKDIKEEKNDLDEFRTIACEPLQHPDQSGVNLTRSEMFGRCVGVLLQEIGEKNKKQWIIAEKIISDVLYLARLEQLTAQTVVGDSY